MHYLSPVDILAIHDRIIEETSGSLGLREAKLLESIAHRPQTSLGGTEQFPSVFLKAAIYLESLATYHVFIDGNKRTALTVAAVFLLLNDVEISLPITESETFMVNAAQRKYTLEEITIWLETQSKR